jgi:hypothetical protein
MGIDVHAKQSPFVHHGNFYYRTDKHPGFALLHGWDNYQFSITWM